MGSTFTTNGGIEKIGLGEQAGSWGTTTNTNFDIIDRLINGVGSLTLSGTSSTLTTSDGSLSNGMFKVLVLGGSPSGTHTITIAPNDANKVYLVKNGTSQSVVFSQGSGADATITAGKGAIIFADGAGSGAAVTDLTALFINSQALNGVTVDNSVIGGTTPAAITGTTIGGTSLTVTSAGPTIDLVDSDSNPDYQIKNGNGAFRIIDTTNTVDVMNHSSGGDLDFDVAGNINLDADGGNVKVSDGGTEILRITNSSSDVIIRPVVDGKDIIFQQRDGTEVARIEDNGTFNVVTDKFAINGTAVTSTADELNKLDGVTRTTSQINSARDGTVTSVATGNGLTGGTITGTGTLSLKNSFLNNTSSAISSSTTTSFTASTYPTFISGRTVSTGGGDFTVTVGGQAHTLSMRDGDGGTFDVFATLLPAGATISGNSFTYVAVQLRPG